MKTKATRLYGVDDIHLDESELPGIKDDEILVKVVSDSIHMSTWKTAKRGVSHKRIPNNVADHPIIIGHEFAGDVVQVEKKWQNNFQPGQKFVQQLVIPGWMESLGYPYAQCGDDTQYCIFPNDIIETGCLWTFEGDGCFTGSIVGSVNCVIGGCHIGYHTVPDTYQHVMGTKRGGDIIILGGCRPTGLGTISYGLTSENKPKRIVVAKINDKCINRAREVINEEETIAHGVELIYVNIATMQNQIKGLMVLMDGRGYDGVFVYIPNHVVCGIGNSIMAYDGCMNLFTGSTDMKFLSMINLYGYHYPRSKIIDSTGGTIDDIKEAIEKEAQGLVESAVTITHVGGLDPVVGAIKNLPDVPDDKKFVYTHINMLMTAIDDFAKLGEQDPPLKELGAVCKKNRGLWSAEAEKALLERLR